MPKYKPSSAKKKKKKSTGVEAEFGENLIEQINPIQNRF
jgi:hypothetical protein